MWSSKVGQVKERLTMAFIICTKIPLPPLALRATQVMTRSEKSFQLLFAFLYLQLDLCEVNTLVSDQVNSVLNKVSVL